MFIKKIEKTITKYNMLSEGDKVLIGVSGGPDSIALIYLLYYLKDNYSLKLYVTHLNHMIRGAQAREDAAFVRNLANELRLPIVVKSEDVPYFVRENKLTLEQGARIIRYKFFFESAKRIKADKIALGHNADDQVETVLMRIIRGTGLQGLGSMHPVSKQEGTVIIRPLIEIWKKDILNYLKQKGLKFRIDASNKNKAYLRNKIRLNLIPHLSRNYNSRIKQTLFRLSECAREDYSYLKNQAQNAFLKLTGQHSSSPGLVLGYSPLVSFSIKALNKYSPAIQREIIRLAIKTVKGNLRKISYQNWQDLDGLIKNLNGSKFLDLPEQVRARKEYGKIVFDKHHKSPLTRKFRSRLRVPGITAIFRSRLRVETKLVKRITRNKLKKNKLEDKTTELFDYDKLNFPLLLRNRELGDRIRPLGMKGEKKLKNIFIDQKIPLLKRDSIPVVVSGNGEIIWVAGLKVSDKFKITPQTRQILKITLRF
ncbi:MAG: tRNA lysidine(34) synthetase TilS [Candidatus Omnitrophota bacterium]|nr:tRNA lysidine(34) synthetase TilS [Candidatus Omnitrophota bacterium]